MLRVPNEVFPFSPIVWGAICGIAFGICHGVGVCGLAYFEWRLRTTAAFPLNVLLPGEKAFFGAQAVVQRWCTS